MKINYILRVYKRYWQAAEKSLDQKITSNIFGE
jgi:hypothetical protein